MSVRVIVITTTVIVVGIVGVSLLAYRSMAPMAELRSAVDDLQEIVDDFKEDGYGRP